MEKNFRPSIALVLKDEGGYSNHPDDKGGPTMKGVTLDTFRRYVKPDATAEDLKRISDDQVAVIYKRQYWAKVMGSDLPAGVDYAAFDFAVNSGPARSIRYLQAVVGAKQDGVMGPATLAAVNAMEPKGVITALNTARLQFMRRQPNFTTFGRGWMARVKRVEEEAQRMAAQPPEAPGVVTQFIPEIIAATVPGLDKPLAKSSIAWSSVAQTALGGMTSFAAFDWKVALPIVLVAGALGGWIIYQRGRYAGKQRDVEALATIEA
ncbi:glycoside hydrolase family 108 protein [Aureimonas ureilytica]|uniref:glycoside hydrolase family 108 protein n=1 Tax=Aureimonas ureilytica TaxID=401562 RepID=UPI0007346670|nr:glycosyl hydrolase 108 family protein [Aureimonas ureilytica]